MLYFKIVYSLELDASTTVARFFGWFWYSVFSVVCLFWRSLFFSKLERMISRKKLVKHSKTKECEIVYLNLVTVTIMVLYSKWRFFTQFHGKNSSNTHIAIFLCVGVVRRFDLRHFLQFENKNIHRLKKYHKNVEDIYH